MESKKAFKKEKSSGLWGVAPHLAPKGGSALLVVGSGLALIAW
jgi:hypothetical protein